MSSSEGMVFLDTRLACPLLAASIRTTPPMKASRPFLLTALFNRFLCAVFCFLPSVLLAHPGHYHPDETDEFDFFTSAVAHSHGAFDLVLVGLVIAALTSAVLGVKPVFRISALAVGLGSLSLLPIL